MRLTITPAANFPKHGRTPSADVHAHPIGSHWRHDVLFRASIPPRPGKTIDDVASSIMFLRPFDVDAPDDILDWDRDRQRDWLRERVREALIERNRQRQRSRTLPSHDLVRTASTHD